MPEPSIPLLLHASTLSVVMAAILSLAAAAILARRRDPCHPDEYFIALNLPLAISFLLGVLSVFLVCCHHHVVAQQLERELVPRILHGVALALLAAALVKTGRTVLRTRRLERIVQEAAVEPRPRLADLGERFGVSGIVEVQGLRLPSMTLGRLRPWIAISDELLAQVDDGELAAVLCHESVHQQSHDNLKRLLSVFSVSLLGWVPGTRRLYRGWQEACELFCDDRTVARTGQPVHLASVLLKEVKLRQEARLSTPLASAMAEEAFVAGRIRRLLSTLPPCPQNARGLIGVWLLAISGGMFAVLSAYHLTFSLWCLLGGAHVH